jgi:glycosyltransferase involved in cell wall biosynthesis
MRLHKLLERGERRLTGTRLGKALAPFSFRLATWTFSQSLPPGGQRPDNAGAPADEPWDLVFYVPETTKGWILEGICRDTQRAFTGKSLVVYADQPLPRAKAYFVSHYSEFEPLALQNPHILDARVVAFFTHPRFDLPRSMRYYAATLNFTDRVFTMNSASRDYLISLGVQPEKLQVVYGAADPQRFQPHVRTGNGYVGFCMAYYDRKRPAFLLDLVRAMPHRKFCLLGKGWSGWSEFASLLSLPNFTYFDVPYEEYPAHYGKMDVFVSGAQLEGGPIPLLEAMLCNAVPVATRTGFAPDLIRHGENGFLFDVGDSVHEVARLIERAYQLETDVRLGVQHLSWTRFASEIDAVLA